MLNEMPKLANLCNFPNDLDMEINALLMRDIAIDMRYVASQFVIFFLRHYFGRRINFCCIDLGEP